MQFTVTGRHIEITEAMKQYAAEKAGRLERFYDRLDKVDVVVDRESLQHRVEVVAHTDHKQSFVGQVDAGDYYEAIDLVMDKMVQQLKKYKEKQRGHKHGHASDFEGTER